MMNDQAAVHPAQVLSSPTINGSDLADFADAGRRGAWAELGVPAPRVAGCARNHQFVLVQLRPADLSRAR